jgi:hypothetical protein
MDRLEFALGRLRFVRRYTLSLLDETKPEDWFCQPQGVSHVAWQVGHIALAQYGLALAGVRGKRLEDDELLPPEYHKLFGRGSLVDPSEQVYPSPAELRSVLDGINARIQEELQGTADVDLDEPSHLRMPFLKTRFDAFVFCGEHEMIHAGQIGLLRRLLGYAAVR